MKVLKLLPVFLFSMCFSSLIAQTHRVGINTSSPTANLHVYGNIRIQNIPVISQDDIRNISLEGFNNQTRYKALYWDPKTKYIGTRRIDEPFATGVVEYNDNENHANPATEINLDPAKYEIFVTSYSPEVNPNAPEGSVLALKPVKGKNDQPISVLEIDRDRTAKKFKVKMYFDQTQGGKLFYWLNNNLNAPASGQEPIWKASYLIVNKAYVSDNYAISVDFPSYWEDKGGAKHGINLQEIIENRDLTPNENGDIEKTLVVETLTR